MTLSLSASRPEAALQHDHEEQISCKIVFLCEEFLLLTCESCSSIQQHSVESLFMCHIILCSVLGRSHQLGSDGFRLSLDARYNTPLERLVLYILGQFR